MFTTNNGNDTITVNETDHVILTCTATGRPTPHMQISTDSRAVVTRPQGPVTAEQLATLTYDSSDVPCDFAGAYTCQVDNGEGRTDTSSVAVFVNCEFLVYSHGYSNGEGRTDTSSVAVFVNCEFLVYSHGYSNGEGRTDTVSF